MTTIRTLVLAALAASLVPAAAQAQYASAQPAPLYPYMLQPGQPYAVEVAPGTYVIKRSGQTRAYPYVSCGRDCETPPPRRAEPRAVRRVTRNDPAVIEELRRRHGKIKHEVVNTTKVVREKPIVIEHQRVVDDPPRIIERRHYVDDTGRVESAPPPPRQRTAKIELDVKREAKGKGKGKEVGKAEKRIIRAEAEVTILGPDRMSIRLFRKRKGGDDANAEAE